MLVGATCTPGGGRDVLVRLRARLRARVRVRVGVGVRVAVRARVRVRVRVRVRGGLGSPLPARSVPGMRRPQELGAHAVEG